MEFKDYYNSLSEQITPRKRMRQKIAEACGVSELTVRRWAYGEIIPDKLKREKISKMLKISVNELWPSISKNDLPED